MDLSRKQIAQLRSSLQHAVIALSERCLYQSAKWAAELLNSLHDNDDDEESFTESMPYVTEPGGDYERRLESLECHKYLEAKAYFDCRELKRAASVFLTETAMAKKQMSQRSLFLSMYALLLDGEKSKTEELGLLLGPSDTGGVDNKHIGPISTTLSVWFERDTQKTSQGWLEYLYGIVLAKKRNRNEAISWLLKSVELCPWNWGAWQELANLIKDTHHLNWVQSQLTPSIMGLIFSVYCRQELHQDDLSLIRDITQLQTVFTSSLFLQGQRAMVFYRAKDMYQAKSLFSDLTLSDPRYLEFVDHYSNVLHTLGQRDQLAFLAQLCSKVDKYRPETCCVIGNYYSLISRHEDAVSLFRRALMLDRNFSAAWTLLGHEYAQLQNPHAAIECYRRAVHIDQKDHRACAGLGKAYELLDQPTYALSYYRQAANLRPRDADVWQSLASCLTRLSLFQQASSTLKTAITSLAPPLKDRNNHLIPVRLTPYERVGLLFRSAEVRNRSGDRVAATRLLEICIEEHMLFDNEEASDSAISRLNNSVIPQAKLLLAQWAKER